MFTGIIEALGRVENIERDKENVHFTLSCPFTHELTVDQSVAHNGTCLTVVKKENNTYTVTAIQETLNKTCLGGWHVGTEVNLERCTVLGDRLDGHIVQGHVDQTGECTGIEDQDGSTFFTFKYDPSVGNVTIEKGSVSVNGVSLTVVNSKEGQFSVAIIPFTIENTQFKHITLGHIVNLEFDVIGKYVQRMMGKA